MAGFAKVEIVPGLVTEIAASLSVDDSNNWYAYAGEVQVGWQFDGERFTPQLPDPEPLEPYVPSITEEAQTALVASDVTILRCLERGIAPPETWITYRELLRDVVAGRSQQVPQRPAYPPNT